MLKNFTTHHYCVICICTKMQPREIKASNSPLDTLAQNFYGYADKESKEVVTKRQTSTHKIRDYVIYVDDLIDLSEGKIPQNGNSLGLDKFISEISSGEFSSYASLRCLMPCKFSKPQIYF